MNRVQRYLFLEVFRAVVVIVGGLAILAILAQGLSQTDLIVESRQSALTYFYVVLLGAPQIIALLTPLAIFVAGVWALNRIHRDSEIVVAQAAGMTRWQTASPILRLAALAAVVHLSINLWVQPTAQREMRATISDARADLAAALIRPGQFTSANDDLTFYARDLNAGELRGIMISDARNPESSVDYLAQSGAIVTVEGTTAIVMNRGQRHELDENDALTILDFEKYTFDLTPFLKEDSDLVLKASDKYLHELFFVDETNYQQINDRDRYLSEAHARLTTPLLSIAMALLAVIAVLGGDFSRRGYGRRISIATGGALGLVIVQLAVQSASAGNPSLNIVQWIVPLIVIGSGSWLFFQKGRRFTQETQGPAAWSIRRDETPA
ncbi:MAG: LptF/LptG family permease [Pseudomonadota bacterium]